MAEARDANGAPAKGAGSQISGNNDAKIIAHNSVSREAELADDEVLLQAAEAARLARRRAARIHGFVRIDADLYQLLGELLQQLGAAESAGDSCAVDLVHARLDALEAERAVHP